MLEGGLFPLRPNTQRSTSTCAVTQSVGRCFVMRRLAAGTTHYQVNSASRRLARSASRDLRAAARALSRGPAWRHRAVSGSPGSAGVSGPPRGAAGVGDRTSRHGRSESSRLVRSRPSARSPGPACFVRLRSGPGLLYLSAPPSVSYPSVSSLLHISASQPGSGAPGAVTSVWPACVSDGWREVTTGYVSAVFERARRGAAVGSRHRAGNQALAVVSGEFFRAECRSELL